MTAETVVVAGIAAFAIAIAPFARVELAGDTPSAATIFAVIMFAELLTAVLLLQRFIAERDRRLLLLGATYLLSGLLFLARHMVQPDIFRYDRGVFGSDLRTGMVTGMWLWVAAHAVFALGIAGAIVMRRGKPPARRKPSRWQSEQRLVMVVVVATSVVTVILTWLIYQNAMALPRIRSEGVPALPPTLVAVVLALWFVRRRDVVERWALVALAASAADVALTALGARPYTLGWYSGRILSLVAASVLMIAMIGQLTRLYRKLADAHRRLVLQASLDTLTGALARGAVLEEADHLLWQARNERVTSTMAIIDIDHFKQINDAYGHLVGDRVLIEITNRILAVIRSEDRLGRFGGDEFVLLMPGISGEQAAAIAERVMTSMTGHPLETEGGAINVTLSIGMAEIGPDDQTMESVMEFADAALYSAKAHGRNYVVMSSWSQESMAPASSSPVSTGQIP